MASTENAVVLGKEIRPDPAELKNAPPEEIKKSIDEVRSHMDETLKQLEQRMDSGKVLDYVVGLITSFAYSQKDNVQSLTQKANYQTQCLARQTKEKVKANKTTALVVAGLATAALAYSLARKNGYSSFTSKKESSGVRKYSRETYRDQPIPAAVGASCVVHTSSPASTDMRF